MGKKKSPAKQPAKDFNRNPFGDLKGFAVSGEAAEKSNPLSTKTRKAPSDREASFADEMDRLGVKRLDSTDARDESIAEQMAAEGAEESAGLNEDELFLQAMGTLQANFADQLPEEGQPPTACARRLKQLKQGRLTPQASLDLHGLKRSEVVGRLRFFLQDASYQGWQTLLVITGRGLHSEEGEPVLRAEAERFLDDEGRTWVVEWSRAPKQYGGAGALILFLRKQLR